jgi:hypothetical protein
MRSGFVPYERIPILKWLVAAGGVGHVHLWLDLAASQDELETNKLPFWSI